MSTDWAAHDLTVQNHHGGNLAATSRIRHVLIAAITAGDIAPGARLKEIDLGQQLGVSRTPLREAMSALKACLLYTSPSPRDRQKSRMPSSA